MTQRTEGLVTYTEETRMTEALVMGENGNEMVRLQADKYAIRVTPYGPPLTLKEARALRDAITVMLGEEAGAKPLKDVIDSAEREAGDRIIARLNKERPRMTVGIADDGSIHATRKAVNIVREECGLAE